MERTTGWFPTKASIDIVIEHSHPLIDDELLSDEADYNHCNDKSHSDHRTLHERERERATPFIKSLLGIIDGSCHEYHFCRNKTFVAVPANVNWVHQCPPSGPSAYQPNALPLGQTGPLPILVRTIIMLIT